MKLSLMLPKTQIMTSYKPKGQTKSEIITELVDFLYDNDIITDETVTRDEIISALLARELQQSTAVGEGFAFPHARLENLKGFYMLLAVAPDGVAFDSLDGEPAKFIVLNLVRRSTPQLLLKTRAAITRFLMHSGNQKIALSGTPESLWSKLDDSAILVEDRILAKDMMKPVHGTLSPDMTLEDAARALHKARSDSLPILDEKGVYINEFTCYDLFVYGIPKFFSQLYSVSYVRDMNPFEKYFMTDRSQKIGEIDVERSQPLIKPGATIMEIIFEMTTHNRHQLYVVDEENHLLGVIDRYSIVDKILISNVSEV